MLLKTDQEQLIFGSLPERPLHLSVRPISVNDNFLDGGAVFKQLEMQMEFHGQKATVPFTLVIPKSNNPCPAVIVIGEDKESVSAMDKWLSKGYAVLYLYYEDISKNNSNFKSGISAFISPSRRKKSSAGKIAVWAWSAIRTLECAEVLFDIDKDNIGVSGEGIFGLSALYAKKNCPKFSFVVYDSIPDINEEFMTLNSHLFSPKAPEHYHFDN